MVMEPADVRDLPDRAAGWLLRRPRSRRILVQGEVSAPLVIIIPETPEGPSKGPLIPHDDMVETLAPQGPDQAFHVGILPRGARCDHELLGTTPLQEATEVWSVDAVAIPQEIRGCGLVGKGFSDLLPGPGGGRMVGHIHMHDAAAVVGEDDEDEQDAEGRRWHSEEVHRRTLRQVRSEERAPGW